MTLTTPRRPHAHTEVVAFSQALHDAEETPTADAKAAAAHTPQARNEDADNEDTRDQDAPGAGGHTPAGLTEAMLPEINGSFWLLITSDALLGASQHQVLQMVLNRTAPSSVLVALDVNWQAEHWGLPPEAGPTAEVLRRFQQLAEAAALIRCTSQEAEAFFFSRDPERIKERLAHRPAVLVTDPAGVIRWSIGGHCGRIAAGLVQNPDIFLAEMLENLCANPQLLATAGRGIQAIADPDRLCEQLRKAAAASGERHQEARPLVAMA